jgi:hypothetical protein
MYVFHLCYSGKISTSLSYNVGKTQHTIAAMLAFGGIATQTALGATDFPYF